MAVMAFSTDANAVTMMTASSSSSFLSDSSVVMPLMPGIITSTMAASNGMLRASSMPSSPLAASRTA